MFGQSKIHCIHRPTSKHDAFTSVALEDACSEGEGVFGYLAESATYVPTQNTQTYCGIGV